MRLLLPVFWLAVTLLPRHGMAETAPSPGERSAPQLVRASYQSTAGEERDVFVYLPAGYGSDRTRRWPVLLFLHGDGERGDGREDLDWVLVHGPLYEAWIQKPRASRRSRTSSSAPSSGGWRSVSGSAATS